MTPPMNTSGMNTAASDSVIDRIVNETSSAPSSAASRGGCPCSMCRTTFSSITMASSTTNPTASVSAISDRLSMLKFSTYITENVPTMAMGSVRLGITVAVTFRRNTKITSTTNTSAASSESFTSRTLSLMPMERSYRVVTFTEGGSAGRISSSAAFTRSATATVFVPGCRMTASTMARSPLYQLAFLSFCTSSNTPPRSPRWIGAPLRLATTMRRNSSALDNCPVARMVTVRSFPYSTPVGSSTLLLRTAAATSLTLKPRVVSCAGSSRMRTAYFAEPNTFTCDTPSTCDKRCEMVVSATSSRAVSDIAFEVSAKKRIGEAAGFCFL